MPRSNNNNRNSSKPSRGGRSGRDSSASKPGARSFKGKSDSSSAKPFKKSSSRDGDKPFGRKKDSDFEGKKSFGRSAGGDKPFRGKREDSGAGEKKSFGARGGKTFGKPREERSASGKRSFSGDREERSSRPYTKREGGKSFRDKGDDNPKKGFSSRTRSFDKSGDESSSGKRSFSGDREERSSRPYTKREGGKSFDKSGGEGYPKRRSASGDREERSSRPYTKREGGKSFDQDREGPKKRSSSGDREERSSRPYSKRNDEGSPKRRSFSGDREERPTRSFSKREDSSSREDEETPATRKKFTSTSSFKDEEPAERPARGLKARMGKPDEYKKKPRKTIGSKRGYEATDEPAPLQTEKIRLNRYIANSGVSSRREADELITMGLISVNGKVITELGYKVNPGDEVRYESKVLRAEKPVYVLMNKPKGYLTTTADPQERNTVMHLLGSHIKERIYPVGRLDRNTTGLLLLTNDGDLADKLMHPSYNIKKIYKVELDRPFTKSDFQRVMEGVRLEEGVAMVDDLAIISEDNKTVGIELHIGWNRVVRRIFESLEYTVVKLDRSVYAGLDKKDLGRGEWRFLKKEEIVRLKHYK
jgi:23S rRNA pseudouridine2605 synthase